MTKSANMIVAHRGASYAAPENTIPSFNLAFKENADFIEGDFRLTNDNEIVCIHDADTKRVSGNNIKLNVRTSSLAELKELDLGSWKEEIYKGTTIPTLREVLHTIPEGKGIYIEIKDYRKIFIQKLSEILKTSHIPPDKIRIISFDKDTIRSAKEYFSDIKSYWLFESFFPFTVIPKYFIHKKIIRTLTALKCDGVDLNAATYIDHKLVKSLREKRLDVCVYGVDEEDEAVGLISLGVDSLTTGSQESEVRGKE